MMPESIAGIIWLKSLRVMCNAKVSANQDRRTADRPAGAACLSDKLAGWTAKHY